MSRHVLPLAWRGAPVQGGGVRPWRGVMSTRYPQFHAPGFRGRKVGTPPVRLTPCNCGRVAWATPKGGTCGCGVRTPSGNGKRRTTRPGGNTVVAWKEAADNTCGWCGFQALVGMQLAVDHVRPLSQGGTNDDHNLQVLCLNCHGLKSYEDRVRYA